eukprot:364018-Chlamydomonas_euryale.AAC.2
MPPQCGPPSHPCSPFSPLSKDQAPPPHPTVCQRPGTPPLPQPLSKDQALCPPDRFLGTRHTNRWCGNWCVIGALVR